MHSGAIDSLVSVSDSKQTGISPSNEKRGRAKRLGVVCPIQFLCPNEHRLPTPVRQGARSIKNNESSRFQMTECTVVMISSEMTFLLLFHKILLYSIDWSHWRTEKGWQLIVQSSPGLVLTAFKEIVCLDIFFLISFHSS